MGTDKKAIKIPTLGPDEVKMLRELRDEFHVTQSALLRQGISVVWFMLQAEDLYGNRPTFGGEELPLGPEAFKLDRGLKHPARICLKLTPLVEEKLLDASEMAEASMSGVIRAGIRLLYFLHRKNQQGYSLSSIRMNNSILIHMLLPS